MEPNPEPAASESKLVLDYRGSASQSEVAPGKIGFLALGATMLIPGLGQFLAGNRRRGVIWFLIAMGVMPIGLIAAAIPILLPILVIIIPCSIVIQLWMWIDAFRCGHRARARMLGRKWVNFTGGLVLMIAAMVATPGFVIAMAFKQYVAEAYNVPTAGMSPAIAPGDRVLVHKRIAPTRWSIVAFHSPDSPGSIFIQRLVGLPGETIEIIDGVVHVNNMAVAAPPGVGPYFPAPQMNSGIGGKGHPITLGPDEFYLLGDNSRISLDSRYWSRAAAGSQLGAVPRSSIIGTATWTYWPMSRWRQLY